MLLDFQAARAMARARNFERTVHDDGPWSVRIGDTEVWAVRVRTNAGVRFLAHFDDGVSEGTHDAWLLCDGLEVSSQSLTASGGSFRLEWRLSAHDIDSVPV